MTDKFFFVLMAVVAQGCVYAGWDGEHGWMSNVALVTGGVFAGVLMAELLNEGEWK